jgi:hypothetical protein
VVLRGQLLFRLAATLSVRIPLFGSQLFSWAKCFQPLQKLLFFV